VALELILKESSMFVITYLRRELRRRMRQAIVTALGLALGVGLVVTVSAASAGVNRAEASVLSGLYGVGTDLTVTGPSYSAHQSCVKTAPGVQRCLTGGIKRPSKHLQTLQIGPGGSAEICDNGHCVSAAGRTYDRLVPPYQQPFSAAAVTAVARLHGVAAATGVLALVDSAITYPVNPGGLPQLATFTVDGVATRRARVGPLAAATVSSGRLFTAAESDSDVAVVDSGFAASRHLRAGSVITIKGVRFTVVGTVSQPQGSSPPEVYIPLARAQALATLTKNLGGRVGNDVNLLYVAAASAAGIPAVQHEISRLLPGDTVTASSGLAGQVTGSLSDADRLAGDLGRWLAILVLVAAFAVASLLTVAAVGRRSAEFGTLKALGWQTRRIVGQVLGESLVIGIAGAAAGVGLGFAGAAIIASVARPLSATAPASAIGSMQQVVQAGGTALGNRTVMVPFTPHISVGIVLLALILAMAGALLAGAAGGWRIARLRPANALRLVA
jgi:putative ABC transport system permease protein